MRYQLCLALHYLILPFNTARGKGISMKVQSTLLAYEYVISDILFTDHGD